MKSKVLIFGIVIIAICIILTGCEDKKNSEETENQTVVQNKIEEVIENTTEETNVDIGKLYSDDTRLVYKLEDNVYSVFYYNVETVTKACSYVDYNTEEEANQALEEYNKEPDSDIVKAYTDDNFLVLELKEEEFKDVTVSELKKAMSHLQEITK